MIATYDVALVILSVAIAVIAAYTALELAGRVTATQGITQKLWLTGGATAIGIGIWAMNFVGMLAYKLPIAITYDLTIVSLSMVAAIAASFGALYIASRQTLGWIPLLAGGIFMGLAIASMHYIGMVAMGRPAIIEYEIRWVILYLAIAISASLIVLWSAFQLRAEHTLKGILQKIGSAGILGSEIAGIHYTGMAAATMQPIFPKIDFSENILGTSNLAIAVSIATLCLLSLILLAFLFDRRIDEEHRQLAALVASSNDAIIGTTIEGIIMSWNSAAAQLYGYTANDAKGRPISFLIPSNRVDENAKLFEAVKQREAVKPIETQHLTKDGKVIDVSLTVSAIQDLAGLIIGISAIVRDITERKEIERELQKQQQFISAVLENIPDGIVACDRNGILTLFNQASKKFHALPAKPLPPSEWAQYYDLYYADEKTPMSQEDIPLSKALRGERVHNEEMMIISQGGVARTLLANGQAIFDKDGSKLGAVVSLHDVSERKQTEKTLKKLNEELERRVQQRTAELLKANQDLEAEIAQRKQKDKALLAANRKLKQSKLRFRSLVDNIPGVIYRRLHNEQWTIDFITDAIEDISGYPASDFIHNRVRTYTSIIHPKDKAKVEQLVNNAIEQKRPFILEYRLLHTDGSMRWVYEQGRGHFENSQLLWLDGVIFDITQIKQAEETLQETEERFRLLIEGVKDYGIFMLDTNGNITTWNRGAENITGYKAEEIIGQNFSIFYPPEDREIGKTEYELEIANAQGKYEEEGWRVRKDGTYFWTSVVLTALRDCAGNLRGFAKVTRDVTARKHDEQRLRKWADIFQHAGQGLIVTTPQSKVLEMMNPAFAKMHGYTVEELIGQPISILIAPGFLEKTFEQIRISRNKDSYWFETQHIRRDKTIFPVFIDITNVKDNNRNILYSIVNVQDITQRKKAEAEIINSLQREKELTELRVRFISMTSHEFRTPLAAILSSSELLKHYSHKLKETEKEELFLQIEVAIKRMTQLLEDVLAINKAESGKLKLKPEPLKLEKFCREMVAEMQQIAGNNYKINYTSSGDCTRATMDEKLLRHIFTNLLSNAVKYSPKGGIVKFSLTCQDKDVVFQVKDSGIGIPIEEQQNLFSSFYRASNVGNIPGTGLGLSIVKRFVDLHEGHITVESEIGVGTTFTVTIPLCSGEEQNE